MSFRFNKTKVKDVLVIEPHTFFDDRGLYKKNYESYEFKKNGISCEFNESCDLYSKKGALRGLHYQIEDSQAKLIHVVSGILFDVALDLRLDSPTFGKYHAELLKAEDNKVIFVPAGFAHGFISLAENTVFSYQCSGRYLPESCGGIKWDDKDLNIPWPLAEYNILEVIATEKDQSWPSFKEFAKQMKKENI